MISRGQIVIKYKPIKYNVKLTLSLLFYLRCRIISSQLIFAALLQTAVGN